MLQHGQQAKRCSGRSRALFLLHLPLIFARQPLEFFFSISICNTRAICWCLGCSQPALEMVLSSTIIHAYLIFCNSLAPFSLWCLCCPSVPSSAQLELEADALPHSHSHSRVTFALLFLSPGLVGRGEVLRFCDSLLPGLTLTQVIHCSHFLTHRGVLILSSIKLSFVLLAVISVKFCQRQRWGTFWSPGISMQDVGGKWVSVIALCGGLNRYGTNRFICLNALPIGSGTMWRCDLHYYDDDYD